MLDFISIFCDLIPNGTTDRIPSLIFLQSRKHTQILSRTHKPKLKSKQSNQTNLFLRVFIAIPCLFLLLIFQSLGSVCHCPFVFLQHMLTQMYILYAHIGMCEV